MPTDENDSDNENDEDGEWKEMPKELPYQEVKWSCTGRTIHSVKLYQNEYQGMCANTNYYSVLGDACNEEDSNDDEENAVISEILNVRAGIGGGFYYSSELKVLNYR